MAFRVWWVRNVPGEAEFYPVASIEEASTKLNELAQADLASPSVVSNAGGLEVLEGGRWVEYYDEQGDDISAIIRRKKVYVQEEA